MRYISLFSGIEAASVAWKPLAWTPAAFGEIEPFPCALLKHHYPDVPNHGDVTKFDWSVYKGECEMIVGGSPCQSFSVAGLRGSMSDERGNLALAYCKVVHAVDPLWSLYENVPGILSTKDNAFGCVLAGLVGEDDELAVPPEMGTMWPDAGVIAGPKRTLAWRILDAQFQGLAQRRRRVFVLSIRGSGNWRCAQALFPVADGVSWDTPSREGSRTRVAASLTRGADSSGRGGYAGRRREDDVNLVVNTLDAHMGMGGPDDNAAQANHLIAVNNFGIMDVSSALSTSNQRLDGDTETFVVHESLGVAHALRGEGFDASEDGTGRGTPIVATLIPFDTTQITSGVNRNNPQPGDPCHPLASTAHSPAVEFQTRIGRNGRGQPKEITDALTSCEGGTHADSKPHVAGLFGVRRLMPVECERLQGFPDGWTNIPFNGKPASDSVRYRAIGNSMAVPCVRWIGERIELLKGDEP